MFLNQHDDFLKTLLMGLSHFIALCNGFFKSFHILLAECILAIAMPCDLYGLTKSFVYSTVYAFSVKSI